MRERLGRIAGIEITQIGAYKTVSSGKPLLVDFIVLWRIADPQLYYRSVQGDEERARQRIAPTLTGWVSVAATVLKIVPLLVLAGALNSSRST